MHVAGLLTLILGCVLFVADHMFHEKVSEFFSLENLDEDDLLELSASNSPLKVNETYWTGLLLTHHLFFLGVVGVCVVCVGGGGAQ